MTSTVPSAPADATGWSEYFDAYAPNYDAAAFSGAGLAAISARDLQGVRLAFAGVEPTRILDAGAGTGRITRDLLAAGWSVVALDASNEMLNQLRAAHPEVETVEAALGTELPFDDDAFDATVAMRVLKYVDDMNYALRELARVVRPGGRVVVEFANAASCARFGYGTSPIHLVRVHEMERMIRSAGLVADRYISGPRLPQPLWEHARTERAARFVTAVDTTAAWLLGGRRSRLGARSIIVSATRR